MRLKTIWTLPSMSTMERLRRTREWAAMEMASRLPLRVRYWVTMQEIAKATRNQPGHIMATPLDEVLKNLDHK